MRRAVLTWCLLLAGIFCISPASAAQFHSEGVVAKQVGGLDITRQTIRSLKLPQVAFWQSRDSNYNQNIVSGGGSYTSSGDIIAYSAWYSCTFGYSAAYAAPGTNPACDVVDTATGLTTCTFHVASSGTVSPTECNATACASACSVTKVHDQTGNGRDVIMTTLANMPLMAFSVVNGHQSMYSGNVTSALIMLICSSCISNTSQPTSLSGVAERIGDFTSESDIITSDDGASNFNNMGFLGANAAYLYAGGVANYTANDSTWHALNADMSSGSGLLNVDGVDGSSLSVGSGGTGTSIHVFDNNNARTSNYYIGETGMIIGGSGTTMTQRNNLCHNQTTRWGLGLSC